MERKVFISYRHSQGKWVRDELVPALNICGCRVLVDRDWFRAGEDLNDEIKHWQQEADAHVLVWTKDYFESKYCQDETNRALDSGRVVVPVTLDDCTVPARAKELLRVDMQTPGADGYESWRLLLEACQAPKWLWAVRLTAEYIRRGQSVNLVADGQHLWEPLLRRVKTINGGSWGEFDLESPWAILRKGFVKKLLEVCGTRVPEVPEPPGDLLTLHDQFVRKDGPSTLTLTHFDYLNWLEGYDVHFFATLRNLIMAERKLVLLAHSHKEFANILPKDHPFSAIDIKTVELR